MAQNAPQCNNSFKNKQLTNVRTECSECILKTYDGAKKIGVCVLQDRLSESRDLLVQISNALFQQLAPSRQRAEQKPKSWSSPPSNPLKIPLILTYHHSPASLSSEFVTRYHRWFLATERVLQLYRCGCTTVFGE